MKAFIRRYSLHIVFILFLANIGLVYAIRLITKSKTCFTTGEVAADARCLYILNGHVYEKGTRFLPHKAHPCGIDVTAIIPAFHLEDAAKYLDPTYTGDICTSQPTVTPVPPTATPTVSPHPTSTDTPTPSVTPIPTSAPSVAPSVTPTRTPTATPTATPSPSAAPTVEPTRAQGIGNPPTSVPTPTTVIMPSTVVVSTPAISSSPGINRTPACSPPPAVKGVSLWCPICR